MKRDGNIGIVCWTKLQPLNKKVELYEVFTAKEPEDYFQKTNEISVALRCDHCG